MFFMRLLTSFLLAVVLGSLLSACSLLPDHRLSYRDTAPEPALRLPEGVQLEGSEDLFVVPNQELRAAYDPDESFEVPLPPELNVISTTVEPAPSELNPEKTRVVLSRDGSGYPMIMMHTSFAWAWEYVSKAILETDLEVEDRDRESGVFYLEVPKSYGLETQAHLKLSQTAAGIQITVIEPKEGVLAEKGSSLDMLQTLYDQL